MLTDDQVEKFESVGAVTVDTPFSEQEIRGARDAFDEILPKDEPDNPDFRPRVGQTGDIFQPRLLDIIQHPFLEEVASQVLRAKAVIFFQTAILKSYPRPNAAFEFGEHTDIQYSISDMASTPKRMVCSYFLWLSDVNEKRSPMMHRPGSHLLIGEWRENDPQLARETPGVKGTPFPQLPKLAYTEPEPVIARAGQVTVLTTAMVHAGSTNIDTEARYAFVITFHPRGVHIGLPESQATTKAKYDRELISHLRPERRHLIQIP